MPRVHAIAGYGNEEVLTHNMLLCFVREALVRDNQPRSRCLWPGLLVRVPAQSRQRKPTILSLRRQSGGRGLRRDGCMGALGSTARSLATKSQTNVVFSVRSASFASAAPRKLAVLTAIAVVLAGRSLAAILPVLADMRSIAACVVLLWAHRCSCRSRQFAAVGMSESIQRSRRS